MAVGPSSNAEASLLRYIPLYLTNRNADQDHWPAELKSLLAEGPERIEHRLGEMFDCAAGDAKDRIVLCGAGPLGRRTLRGLRNAGIEPLGFLDNNSRVAAYRGRGDPSFRRRKSRGGGRIGGVRRYHFQPFVRPAAVGGNALPAGGRLSLPVLKICRRLSAVLQPGK